MEAFALPFTFGRGILRNMLIRGTLGSAFRVNVKVQLWVYSFKSREKRLDIRLTMSRLFALRLRIFFLWVTMRSAAIKLTIIIMNGIKFGGISRTELMLPVMEIMWFECV